MGLRAIAAGMLPALVALAFAGHLFRATPRDSVPVVDDEIAFWNQIAAFERAGFSGGYHTVNEIPSRAGFSRFGPHGPAYPLLYGSIARISGWRPYSASVVSMVLVSLAATWWYVASGGGTWAALAIATFWPLILFLPSARQESLHFALALTFAAATVQLLASSRPVSAWVPLLSGCYLAGLLRPTWALLAIPGAWLAYRDHTLGTRLAAVGAAVAGVIVVTAAFGWLAAPYPGAILSASTTDPWPLILQGLARLPVNAATFVDPRSNEPMVVFIRYEALAILIGAALDVSRARDRSASHAMLPAILMGVMFAALFVAGSVELWRDLRAVSPMLLVALLVWLPSGARFSRAIVLVNALAAPLALSTFASWHTERYQSTLKTSYVRAAITDTLVFRENEPGWTNTLLVHADAVDPALVALPHGISISVAIAWEDIVLPPRSRYLLLRPQDVDALRGRFPLRPLATTPIGTLYENSNPRAR